MLKKYHIFIKESKRETDDYINDICTRYDIRNYTINGDGSINVNDDVRLFDKELTSIPLKFGIVTGDFICSYNKLTSLDGSPKSVGGGFYCDNNKLT
jgi:hypothetical protein